MKAALGEKTNPHEPKPTVCSATPPRSLTDPNARKLYRAYAKELTKLGVLTTIDREELARACDLYVAAQGLWEKYKAEPVVENKVRGREINPAYRAALQGFADARKILVTFGIGSPADRSRLKVALPTQQKTKWSGLLTGNN
jgi:P27 family predicted phage terminase small subunit